MDFIIYLVCLVVGVVFVLFTMVAGHLGGGDHHIGSGGHAEAGADGSDGPAIQAFSPVIIAAFITTFGAFGVIFTQIPATKTPWISAPLAIFGASVVSAGVLSALRLLVGKTQSSSESKVGELAGRTATIITPIPENGVGEIAYVQGGTRYSAPAREEKGRAVANGKVVKITRVMGSQFYIEACEGP